MIRSLAVALALVLLCSPDALAQGRRGGGSGPRKTPATGGTDRERTPRADPSASRKDTADRGADLFTKGSPTTADLTGLLTSGSTGKFPSSTASRAELASALSEGLAGKTLKSDRASALSGALAAAANPDGLSKSELAAKRSSLAKSLKESGLTEAQIEKIEAAWDKVVSEQQQANLQKLADDLEAILAESTVTSDMVKKLATDLKAMAEGATKPDSALVTKLATDLAAALDDGALSPLEAAQLTRDLEDVLNSANISQEEFAAVAEDAKAILLASGVDMADVELIVADLQAIYDAMRKPAK